MRPADDRMSAFRQPTCRVMRRPISFVAFFTPVSSGSSCRDATFPQAILAEFITNFHSDNYFGMPLATVQDVSSTDMVRVEVRS